MLNIYRYFLFFLVCCGSAPSAFARGSLPAFQEYSVGLGSELHNHAYVKTNEGSPACESTRQAMAKHRPNLAGHYVAYSMDCGGGAMCGEILDVLTGKVVVGFPTAYSISEKNAEQAFDFSTRPDSRLVVVLGIGQGKEKDQNGKIVPNGFYTRYYDFDGHTLKLVYLKN